MADYRSTERDLDRFWNDVVAGNTQPIEDPVDPGDAEMIRLLRRMGNSQQARGSRDRVRATVDAEIERLERGPRANGRMGAAPSSGGGAAPRPARTPVVSARDRRRPAAWLPAAIGALLIVVALAAIGFVLRANWRTEPDERTAVPASVGTASPEPTATAAIPGVSQSELIELAIPAEFVPAGPASVALSHLTLPPGESGSQASAFNVGLYYLLSGQLSVRVDGEAQVLRAGSQQWEPVEANAEITLGSGDAVLLNDLGDVAFSNPGSAPAEAIAFGLTSDATGVQPLDAAGWIINDSTQLGAAFPLPSAGVLLPGKPAVLRLALVVLEPRAVRPIPPADRFELTVVVPDNGLGTPTAPNVAITADGRTRNLGVTSIAVYSVTLEIPEAAGAPLAVDPGAACPFPVGTAFATGACDAGGLDE